MLVNLFDWEGRRKYLATGERKAFLGERKAFLKVNEHAPTGAEQHQIAKRRWGANG
jgi:hypothetical protein